MNPLLELYWGHTSYCLKTEFGSQEVQLDIVRSRRDHFRAAFGIRYSKKFENHFYEMTLAQGWATIFVRGPHCAFLGASRARFQSKRLI
jgi:hypothetical protein